MADARDDVAVFASEVLGRPLWPHQLEAARSSAFVTSVAAARRVGKTTLAETLAMHVAMTRRGARVVVLSATELAARRLTEEIGRTLTERGLTRPAVTDDYSTRIKLANGGEIISLPSSPKQIRGLGREVMLVIVDEASFCDAGIWQAARYLALDHRAEGSRILLLGTPRGGVRDFFRVEWEAGRDGERDHESFHWTYKANPLLDHAYLERERDRVSPIEYSAEVLGEWSDASGSLFPWRLLDSARADVDLFELDGLPVGPKMLVGVDWGVSFDQSAAVVIARLPVASLNPGRGPLPTFGIVAVEAWPPGELLTNVARAVAGSPALWEVVSSEVSGVGAGPSQETRALLRDRVLRDRRRKYTWNPVHTSAKLKTEGYGWLLALLERGQLVLPCAPALLRQMASLRVEHRERGFVRIEGESDTVHDDLADGAMLATGVWSDGGRPRCYLAEAARRAVGVPDAPVPAGADVVLTGGGLRVPRRLAVQSVTGADVWVPRRAARESEPEHIRRAREAVRKVLSNHNEGRPNGPI